MLPFVSLDRLCHTKWNRALIIVYNYISVQVHINIAVVNNFKLHENVADVFLVANRVENHRTKRVNVSLHSYSHRYRHCLSELLCRHAG